MCVGAELCHSGLRDRHILPGGIKFHGRSELNLFEVALLLCLTEREGKARFAADRLVVIAERGSGELDDLVFAKASLNPCHVGAAT